VQSMMARRIKSEITLNVNVRHLVAETVLPWFGDSICSHVCIEQVESESLIAECAYVIILFGNNLKGTRK